LLIGLQIDLNILFSDWNAILWAILAVLVARAASIYGLSWIGPGIPRRYKHILYWGGLRGAISLALALSLPASLGAQRPIIQSMAFGVVLFTLLVQGPTMKPFISRLGLIEKSEAQREYESLNARAVMARSALNQLKIMYKDGLISRHVWALLSKPIETHADTLVEAAANTMSTHPDVETRELESAIQEALKSERAALRTLLQDGNISEETFADLVHEVDTSLTENHADLIQTLRMRTMRNIQDLMTIIIQEKDLDKITSLLLPYGYPLTHIASTGGFMGRKNATLLVGVPTGERKDIRELIEKSSKGNVEFLPESDSNLLDLAHSGATIFTLNVARYEEL
jgi:NhaP-type Na+/H+ or K+/H+ antiporter